MINELFVQAFLRGAALDETADADGIVPASIPLQGLEQLKSVLGINVKQHPQYSELYHFSYDQLESPKGHPIVNECRGLILDSDNNWEVVAFPFSRFANYGESWTAPIDWSSVRVQEKVDGSLMIFWFYKGTWNISTKGSPDAGGDVGDFGFTFSELFWKTLKTQYSNAVFNPHYTYMIELTSIYNRIVCQYGKETRLTLIGARDISAPPYKELRLSEIDPGLPEVKEYALQNVSDIIKAAEILDPMVNEGFVVVDKNFNRVKIKSPSYVMIHHLKDGFGQRRMIRLIQLGEQSEVLSYFPEYQELFDEVKIRIDQMIVDIEREYKRIRHLTDRKEFALEAVKFQHSGVLFSLFLGKATDVRQHVLHEKRAIKKATLTEPAIEDFQFSEDKIERMIGLKERPAIVLE